MSYTVNQLVFELLPVAKGDVPGTVVTGMVYGAFQYDPNQEIPDNVRDMIDLSGSCKAPLGDGIRVGVECDPSKVKDTEYFVRTGPVPYLRDVDEFDHGKLVIATDNVPAAFSNLQLYSLVVSYNITFRMWKPDRTIQRDYFVCSTDALESASPNVALTPATYTVLAAQLNNMGCRVTSTGPGVYVITFPADFAGSVELKLFTEGTSLTRTSTAISVSGNVDLLSDMYGANAGGAGDLPTYATSCVSSTSTLFVGHVRVKTATGGLDNVVTITQSGGAATGTIGQWALDIYEYSTQLQQSRSLTFPLFVNGYTGAVTSA